MVMLFASRRQVATLQISDAVVLATPRLLLRDFHEDDAGKIAEYFGEREAQRHILRRQRKPRQMSFYVECAARYARDVPLSSRHYLDLAIALRDTRELVGMCSLTDVQPGSPCARIGWHLSTRFSGFGYATEAGRELVKFAFEERRVARVYADCYESNAANLRVFVKLGMRPLPWLSLLKWLFALRYLEPKPIVRYSIENQFLRSSVLAA